MYFITTKRMLEVCFFQHTPTFIIEPILKNMQTTDSGIFEKRISDSVVSSFTAASPEEPDGGRFCRCIWKKQGTNSLNLFQLTL